MKNWIKLYFLVFNYWMKFPEKLRYLLVGGYNTVVSYLIFVLLLWMMNGKHEQIALLLSFAISSINSYWTQKIYVFGTKGNVKKEYLKCLVSWGASYVLNVILLALFVDLMEMTPYLAQFIALILVTINSYLMLKRFAFKGERHDKKN